MFPCRVFRQCRASLPPFIPLWLSECEGDPHRRDAGLGPPHHPWFPHIVLTVSELLATTRGASHDTWGASPTAQVTLHLKFLSTSSRVDLAAISQGHAAMMSGTYTQLILIVTSIRASLEKEWPLLQLNALWVGKLHGVGAQLHPITCNVIPVTHLHVNVKDLRVQETLLINHTENTFVTISEEGSRHLFGKLHVSWAQLHPITRNVM